jgi:hypothetical protein
MSSSCPIVCVGGKQSVGAKNNAFTQLAGVEVARIVPITLGQRTNGAGSQGEQQEQPWGEESTAPHRATI